MSLIDGMKPRAEAGGPGKWSVDGKMSPRLLTISFLVPFVLSLVFSGAAIAQESTSPISEETDFTQEREIDAQITRGIILFTNERMTEALSIFQKIIDRHKDDPKGYFYTAAVYGVAMQDYKTREFEQEFNHFIELTIAKAESRLTVNNNDAEAQFYLGGAYGYRGIDKTLVGSWLGAFLDGTKGVFHLHKAVSYNPKFYDAYYGIGSYHYWVSVRASILWFLPFFADERAQGIEEIRLASTKGQFARYEAKASLITILMNEKRWEEALKISEEMLAKFPDDISSRIQKGIISASLGRWPKVEQTFKAVKGFLPTRPFHGYMRKLEAEYYLALAAQRQQRSATFFERCVRVRELTDANRDYTYTDGLAELEEQAGLLCGKSSLPESQE